MTRSFMKRSGESVYGIQELVRAVLWDVLAIALVLLVPVLSHIVAYPLHAFEPMRIALFWVILLLPEKKWNALMLAALLPMISFVVSGHPLFPKNIVMSGELVINVVLLYWILAKTGSYSLSVLLSMVASKVIYYVVKYLLISSGLLQMELVSTNLGIQIIVIALFTIAFLHYDLKTRKHE